MTSVVRVWSGVALVLALCLVPTTVAQDVNSARTQFEQQEYEAARETLLKIDRDALSADERAQLDQLLALTQQALTARDQSIEDLASAYQAYQAGDWDRADRLYQAVQDNKFATSANREHATTQRDRIASERQFGEVAKPSGTVQNRQTMQPVETTPAQPAAQPAPAADYQAPMIRMADPAEDGAATQSGRLTPTGQLRMRDELLWQQAMARYEDLAAKTRTAVEEGDFGTARQLTDTALQTIESAARYAEPVSKYKAARAAALRLQEEVKQRQEDFERVQAEREREEIAQRVAERRAALEQAKLDNIQQLFNSAKQLRDERRFSEAAEVLRQILRIDPANAKARYQLEWAEDQESYHAQMDWERTVKNEQRRALLKADEALIPWDYDVVYPKNWLELTRNRTTTGVQGGVDLEDIELNRKLDEPLPEIRFDENEFETVVSFLTDYTKLNISVDWTALDDALLDPAREAPVTLQLTNVSLRTVLKEVLAQVGGETELGFAVGDGLLRVSTKEKLDRDKFIRIYDVRDLLATIPNAGRPDFQQQNQGLGQGGGGGGSQNIFGNNNQQNRQQDDQLGGAAQMEKLKEIIRQTVEPDSWVEAGAGPSGGSIQDMNGQLLIYNTSDAHRQVVDLLSQLRETQALQVSVESRFLDVTENFLEQFGVDLDFVFNSGSAGYDRAANVFDPFTGAPVLIPRQYSRIGAYPATPAFGQPLVQDAAPLQPYGGAGFVPANGGVSPHINSMTPIGMQQGSLSAVDPSAINTMIPGSWAQRTGLSPALNIAGSFLDNLQVDFLIRATQANQRSSIVQAPRAVMLNGQAVEIRIEAVRRYISSLEPVVGENAALPRPVPDNANSGLSMWVQSVISADRRYTKLSIALLNQGEPTFDRYELQRGSGNSPSIFLLLPSFSRTTYTTTVSIPDGGTVLLGGFKQVGEVEVEAGVPILSKIPILKRAFTNTTTVRDTRTLLILVKAKILIQQEAEEEAFPTFASLGG